MEISAKIKPEISNGPVRMKLFKEDFIIEPSGWTIHSFLYKAPRGKKTNVDLELHVENISGNMKIVKVKFDYAISKIQKVLDVLADDEAFEVSPSVLAAATIDKITIHDVKPKYPYIKINKMEYKKPLVDVSRTGTLVFEIDIDGNTYPYIQNIKFADSIYSNKFDNISAEMFDVVVAVDSSNKFIIEKIINNTGSDKINVYDSKILGLNESRTFDVILYISGSVKNTSIVVKSRPLDSAQTFDQIFDKVLVVTNRVHGAPRPLAFKDLIQNNPEWLTVNEIRWMNPNDISSVVSEYEVEFQIANEIVTKKVQVQFDHSNDHEFMSLLTNDNIVVDDAYLVSPKTIIPAEATLLVHVDGLPQGGAKDLQVESIQYIGNEFDRNSRIFDYNITLITGEVKKIITKSLTFQHSLNDFAVKEFKEALVYVTNIPAAITKPENIGSVVRQFTEDTSLRKVDMLLSLAVDDLYDYKTLDIPLDIELKEIIIHRFDANTDGNVIIDFGYQLNGETEMIYKSQEILTATPDQIIFSIVKPQDIRLIDDSILKGFRPNYLIKEQFEIPMGLKIINIDITHNPNNLTDLNVNFTVRAGEHNIKKFNQTYTFAEGDAAVINETPDEATDNKAFLETADLSALTIFVEVDKEPPFEITPTMFSGLPENTRVAIDYDWPNVGSGEVELSVDLIRGTARKNFEIPITFKPLTKETLKSYKSRFKKEKRGK